MPHPSLLRLFALLLLGLALTTVQAQQNSRLQRIVESGVLRVGTTGDFKPMSFRDPASRDYVGYDIDVVRQFAEDMGVELEFVATDWKTLINGIVADKYDLTTSASLNMERAKVAGYSDPYIEFGTVPMTLQENLKRFAGWDSINQADITVAVTLGTVFEAQARAYFPDADIKTVEAPARDFQEVLARRALVSVTSNIEAASLMETYPELTTVPVDALRSRRPGAFLLPQGDQIWINYVNHWISLRKTEGFFETLDRRWLDRE
jgi:cyclohexadienyl dehydratase